MTYCINIDQEFAIVNELSLVEVSTLAAFMTLPIWAKTVAIDGFVWYQYSDEKMAEDFPLLFGVAKRCYKNITELAELGFVQLTKLGREKYVRFTKKCDSWNKQKEQIWTESPKTDSKQSEIGLNNSPKSDSQFKKEDYNIIDSNIKTNNISEEGLFNDPETVVVTRPRRTTESLCLFENSRYYDFDTFAKEFPGPEFKDVDLAYYYHAVADWSAQGGKKKRDWIATARNFMRSDMNANKLHRLTETGIDPDYKRYLEMGMEDIR